MVGLAGRAADEILSGGATSGAVGDLRAATRMLAAAHGAFGLGDSLVSRFHVGEATVHNADILKLVDDDLARLLNLARGIVRERSQLILALADCLIERRVATAETIDALADERLNSYGGARSKSATILE